MTDNHITVSTHIGYYEVATVERWGTQVHVVTKDKKCTCGGTAERPCRHIKAVAQYLKGGGERAPQSLPKRDPELTSGPATCPICDALVKHEDRGRWRCPNDASHYFRWRGESNGGAIRRFLTQAHPNKVGAFYDQTLEQRDAFLHQAALRLSRVHS